MHHIFVDEKQIIDNKVYINRIDDKENFNHLNNSLRVKNNEKILISVIPFTFTFDFLTEVISIDGDNIILNIIENRTSNELKIKLNLYQGLPKIDKLEFIIEKSVELGVNSIIPVDMENCVAKVNKEKFDNKIIRFNKISKSASMQSKRNIIPEVKYPISFNQMVSELKNNKFNLLFYEDVDNFETTRKIFSDIKNESLNNNDFEVNIIIGPEGGFSKKEIEIATNNGFSILSLGKRILRTETASIVALSMLNYMLEE